MLVLAVAKNAYWQLSEYSVLAFHFQTSAKLLWFMLGYVFLFERQFVAFVQYRHLGIYCSHYVLMMMFYERLIGYSAFMPQNLAEAM